MILFNNLITKWIILILVDTAGQMVARSPPPASNYETSSKKNSSKNNNGESLDLSACERDTGARSRWEIRFVPI